jgi:AcrR family transcriptional regulator
MHSENLAIDQEKRSFIETARRAQIIECAIEAIADLGFAQASLARIAKRAKVSTGVILYYFAGKEVLIRDVVAHVFAAGELFIRPKVDPSCARAALRSFIVAAVAFIAAQPKHTLAVMNIIRAGRTETGLPRFEPAVETPRRAGFEAVLRWGHTTGEFRPFDVRVMVVTIIEALDAIPPQLADEPDLDLGAYGASLADLFDRATRADTIGVSELDQNT